MYQGNLDSYNNGLLKGWLKCIDSDEPVVANIYLGNRKVVEEKSLDIYREDLVDAGFSHGKFGYEIDLSGIITVEHYTNEIVIEDVSKSQLHSYSIIPEELIPKREIKVRPSLKSRIESVSKNEILGWVVDIDNPGKILTLDLYIDDIYYATGKSDFPRPDLMKHGLSKGFGGFRFDNVKPIFAKAGTYKIELKVHGDIVNETPYTSVNDTVVSSLINSSDTINESNTSIVVPIYNAYDDLIVCVDRLKKYTTKSTSILLINDASPDPRIADFLNNELSDSRFTIHHNDINLGFTSTVNYGLRFFNKDNVVILNSDARVTPGWLTGMIKAANSGPKISTVTAMSDRAGAFSAPNIGNDNPLPHGVSEVDYAKAFRRRSTGYYPVVPTGNGFCMFINRACMNEIGELDSAAFPKGYGEENDFCLRARRAGWDNIIDDKTYVFHDRNKSFGAAKEELMIQGREIVDSRYPEYSKLTKIYSQDQYILAARYRARQAQIDCNAPVSFLPSVLYVVATATGGTPQTNKDLMGALNSSIDCWLLHCNSLTMTLSHFVNGKLNIVKKHELNRAIEPTLHTSNEYDVVLDSWLNDIMVDIIHIRHIAWHSLNLPSIAKRLGVKVIYSLHDYYSICPSVKLIDINDEYQALSCLNSGADCYQELWPQDLLPSLKDNWIEVWQKQFSAFLSQCDKFVTTSSSSRKLIKNIYPSIPADDFVVIPHGRDFNKFEDCHKLCMPGEVIRILLPGNIDTAKGLKVINNLLDIDLDGHLEFHILGTIKGEGLSECNRNKIKFHGAYTREQFPDKVKNINPHFGAIFSIWNETWCHTLTELWSVGVPAFVLGFDTIADRVLESNAGWILDHSDIEVAYEKIKSIAYNIDEQLDKKRSVLNWQQGLGGYSTTHLMASRYLNVYRSALNEEFNVSKVKTIALLCPADRQLKNAPASTHIRVWEKYRARLDHNINYVKNTPQSFFASLGSGIYDEVIIQRNAVPSNLWNLHKERLIADDIVVRYDIDDNLLCVPSDKDVDGVYSRYSKIVKEVVSISQETIVTNAMLKNAFSSINANITIAPNKVSKRLWGGSLNSKTSEDPKILYMGSQTHQEDFELIYPALLELKAFYPNLEVDLIGITNSENNYPKWVNIVSIPNFCKDYVSFTQWLKGRKGYYDFAVAPLVDNEFNNYKSYLKIIEYGAMGLPVLASNVNVYQGLDAPESSVVLVDNKTEIWKKYLSVYLTRQDLLELGYALRTWVFENHAY